MPHQTSYSQTKPIGAHLHSKHVFVPLPQSPCIHVGQLLPEKRADRAGRFPAILSMPVKNAYQQTPIGAFCVD